MRYVEISQHDTKSGHAQLIEWYEDANGVLLGTPCQLMNERPPNRTYPKP